jgi:hypothetical protein
MAVQVVLYQGEANPYSVKLRDPTVVGGSITAVGAWTAGNDTWSGTAKETLTSTGAWTAGNDVWVGIGTPGTVVAVADIQTPVALRPMIKLPAPQFGSRAAPIGVLDHITRNLKGE